MRLLHVIHTLNPDRGGPSESVRMFANAHQRAGNEVELATLDGPEDGPASDGYRNSMNCPVHPCGPGKGSYGYAPKLEKWLSANCERFDGVIVNGVWQYHGVAVRRAVGGRRPYVVFAHGMLDPYFRDRYPLKHLKKLVYWILEERGNLKKAQAVCFTSEEEKRVAALGFPMRQFRGVVIPYGTMGPSGDPVHFRERFYEAWPKLREQKFLLFLGRIHPKKGCDLLIEAFAKAAGPHLRLVIAGPDPIGWGEELKKQAADIGIADRITWTGMLRGDLKWGAFYSAEAFILPSHQENFGIAVADALACGTIPLISDKVNIAKDVAFDGAGLMESDDLAGTERLIVRFRSLTPEQRQLMSSKAKECFGNRFALQNSAEEVYRALGIGKAN